MRNNFVLKFLFIYERQTDREREAETQAEGEAGSMQGARCGTRSWVSRIMPWAKGGAKLLSHLGCRSLLILKEKDSGIAWTGCSLVQLILARLMGSPYTQG